MEHQKHVVCVGQALVDCITRGMEEKPYKKNVYRADSISLNTGGDALNESIVLSHLGHQVSLVCAVGDDLAGHIVLHTARSNGVDVSHAAVSESITTPVANLMVQKNGSRQSANSPATMLTGYEPDERAFRGAEAVSFASLFRAPLDKRESILRLMKAAKAEGAVVCADTKMPTYREIFREDLLEILPYIDYLFPNENEASYYCRIMTGEEQRTLAGMGSVFLQYGVKNVIIKTGEKGCTAVSGNGSFQIPARKVKAVDSTGAGDNFVAGFIHGLLCGWDLRKCCDYGTHCAAVSVQYVGAVTGIKQQKMNGSRTDIIK